MTYHRFTSKHQGAHLQYSTMSLDTTQVISIMEHITSVPNPSHGVQSQITENMLAANNSDKCVASSANILIGGDWLFVNCSQTFTNMSFVCETHTVIDNNEYNLVISSSRTVCGFDEVYVDGSCLRIEVASRTLALGGDFPCMTIVDTICKRGHTKRMQDYMTLSYFIRLE